MSATVCDFREVRYWRWFSEFMVAHLYSYISLVQCSGFSGWTGIILFAHSIIKFTFCTHFQTIFRSFMFHLLSITVNRLCEINIRMIQRWSNVPNDHIFEWNALCENGGERTNAKKNWNRAALSTAKRKNEKKLVIELLCAGLKIIRNYCLALSSPNNKEHTKSTHENDIVNW